MSRTKSKAKDALFAGMDPAVRALADRAHAERRERKRADWWAAKQQQNFSPNGTKR